MEHGPVQIVPFSLHTYIVMFREKKKKLLLMCGIQLFIRFTRQRQLIMRFVTDIKTQLFLGKKNTGALELVVAVQDMGS